MINKTWKSDLLIGTVIATSLFSASIVIRLNKPSTQFYLAKEFRSIAINSPASQVAVKLANYRLQCDDALRSTGYCQFSDTYRTYWIRLDRVTNTVSAKGTMRRNAVTKDLVDAFLELFLNERHGKDRTKMMGQMNSF